MIDRAQDAERLLAERRLVEAFEAFDQAQKLGADADRCSAGRWAASMLGGNFSAAWIESDAIRLRGLPDPHRFWNGEALSGKQIIVRCLHGFGDAVQMLQYAPRLKQLASRVIYELPPQLLQIGPRFEGVTECVTWGEQAPLSPPAWDVQVEVMELPYIFRTSMADLPVAIRYLRLPVDITQSAASAMGPRRRPRVGLVWSAGEWNHSRSIPAELLTALIERQECEFWNLQGGAAWRLLQGTRQINACQDGILPLAAVLQQLDLIITVDTLAAHLAGALDVPAWVLLQHAADWRWMIVRNDSPWYPSVRLFRQPVPGAWAAVIKQVDAQLSAFLARSVGL